MLQHQINHFSLVEITNSICHSVADQHVAGSNPARRIAECNPGRVIYTRISITKQYNLVPANGRWCSAAGEWGGNGAPGGN